MKCRGQRLLTEFLNYRVGHFFASINIEVLKASLIHVFIIEIIAITPLFLALMLNGSVVRHAHVNNVFCLATSIASLSHS